LEATLTKKSKPGSSPYRAPVSPGGDGNSAHPVTISHLFGEMAWLLSQSPLHKALQIGDLEWLVMPALIHQQFYIFRDGDKPVGVALWAKCNPVAEAKLDRGMIEPENRLTLEEWRSGDAVWLVDLIAPFADATNKHREIMIADLISGPLAGQAFKFHMTDPASGERMVKIVEADAGERLREAIQEAAGQ
jgi:cytolysin-activating lysine-acyltransferase